MVCSCICGAGFPPPWGRNPLSLTGSPDARAPRVCRRSRLVTPTSISSSRSTRLQRARQGLRVSRASVCHSSPSKPYSAAVSRIWMMPLRAIVARRRSRPMARRSALPSSASRTNSAWRAAIGDKIEAVGFDDAALRVALAVALAVRAVLHRDEAELDQAAVDLLDLRRRQAERLLLHRGRGPYDRPRCPAPSPAAG